MIKIYSIFIKIIIIIIIIIEVYQIIIYDKFSKISLKI